jgi:L-lactate dehydrogenase complex protein LldG
MSDRREEILGRIRGALDTALLPGASLDHPTNNVPRSTVGLDDFIQEVEALSGVVIRAAGAAEAAQQVASLCQERSWTQALTWAMDDIGVAGLADALKAAGVEAITAGNPDNLKEIPVGITGAEAGLADTGSLVVQNGPGCSSLASLLPPVHIALLQADAIFPDMLTYWESTGDAAAHLKQTSQHIFISGPSRTADIEQRLTLGVHGPRELYVIIWG